MYAGLYRSSWKAYCIFALAGGRFKNNLLLLCWCRCCSIVSEWSPAVRDDSCSHESITSGLLQEVVAVPLENTRKFTVQLLLGWCRGNCSEL